MHTIPLRTLAGLALVLLAGAAGCGGGGDALPSGPEPEAPAAAGRWVSGYYVGYQRALYPPEEVDFSLLTHLFVGRLRPTAGGDVLRDMDVDDVQGPALARALSARAHQAGRRAVLMLGGSGEHAGFVGAASPANRPRFVAQILRAVDELGYDGVDVDWEPIEPADRAPLLALLKELRAARPGMIITLPVGWVNSNSRDEPDPWYAQAAAVVDQLNLMTYDMAGPWGGWESWHFAPLYDHAPTHPSSVASSVQAYLDLGIAPAKLGIGLGFYGSCWRGVTGPRQPLGAGASQAASDNSMLYSALRASYLDAGARRWDAAARAPYLSFAAPRGPQGCTFVSYEDEESIAAKGEFVRGRGLGGVIVWTIGGGHLRGAPAGSRDPLLAAAHAAVLQP